MPPEREPWIVLCELDRRRWGGDLRRALIFLELARSTGALPAQGWGHASVRDAIRTVAGPPYPWRRRPWLASAEFLSDGAIAQARRGTRPVVLDVHDHPVLQAEALGRTLDPATRGALAARYDRNLATFPLVTVPSASFAELAGIEPARAILAPNGSDPGAVVPRPPPAEPTVGMVSGAAPGRGIEALIEATRRLAAEVPGLRLLLWLRATDEIGEAYLASLRAAAREPWITIEGVDYRDLGAELARATVLVVPHPANAYMDVAVPVKLLDSMAASRAVVVTPRLETRRIVEDAGAGVVAGGDTADDLAAAILPLLRDPVLAASLGANGRAVVEREFDWAVIGRRVAVEVITRTAAGRLPEIGRP